MDLRVEKRSFNSGKLGGRRDENIKKSLGGSWEGTHIAYGSGVNFFSGSELTTIEQEDRCDEGPVNHFFERAYGRAIGGRRRKNGYVKARSQACVQS
jgi:hypothetical protein